jgi:hypothetical protein
MTNKTWLCSLALTISACAGEGQGSGSQDSGEKIVALDTTRFPAEEGTLLNTVIDPDQLTLVYGSGVPKFDPGDVVIGAASDGYLRRVLSTSTSGDTVTLQTAPAEFADAFETVRLKRTIHVAPTEAPSPAQRADFMQPIATPEGVWQAHVTYDTPTLPTPSRERETAVLDWVFPNVSVTLLDPTGHARLTLAAKTLHVTKNIDLAFDLDYEMFEVNRVELIKDETTTITMTDVSIQVAGMLPLFEYSIPIFANPAVAVIPVSVLVFTVGVSIDVGVFAKLAATAQVRTESELVLESHTRQGFVWDGDYDVIWEGEINGSAELKCTHPSVTPLQVTAGTFLEASVNLRLYGVLGPEFYGRFVPLSADLSFGTSELTGTLSASAKAGARLKIPVWGLVIFDVPFVEYTHTYGSFTRPY